MSIKGRVIRRIRTIPPRFEFHDMRLERGGFLSTYTCIVKGLPRRVELMHRGHAVAVLAVDFAAREVVMIQQPRHVKAFAEFPAAIRMLERAKAAGTGVTDPGSFIIDAAHLTVLELCAGMVDPGETEEHAAIRELEEESGYVIRPDQLTRVGNYFPTLGGSTEMITAFIARLEPNQHEVPAVGDGSEQIVVWRLSFEEAWRLMRDGQIRTVSALILLRELRIMDLEGRT